ncbi:hypothetical protein ACFQGX_31070 [Nonomuraea dietziae]|uniref:hypothetical protein n=1 Tax=Nonomuraea dietziae TaxID=65515 RepID=UPI00361B78F1
MDSQANGKPAGVLDNPVVGMAPWIIFSVLVGPGRFELSVVLALAVSVLLIVADRIVRRGGAPKLLQVAEVVFFAAMAAVGLVASAGTRRWLETYAGEVSNIALVLIAFGSMAVRMPFTLQYAREQVDRAHWQSPAFLRTNYVITGVCWRSWSPRSPAPTGISSFATLTTSGPAGSSRSPRSSPPCVSRRGIPASCGPASGGRGETGQGA